MSDRRRAYVLNDAQVREALLALRAAVLVRTTERERAKLRAIIADLGGQAERQQAADAAVTKSNKKRG